MTQPAEPALTSNLNLCLSVQQNVGHEARIVRQKIAKHETAIIGLRAEYEKLVRHATIEGVSLDEPAPAVAAPESPLSSLEEVAQ